jgi:hypothetical protein
MASRFNVLSPYRLVRDLASPATRDVALLQMRDSMRALTTVGATLGLLSLVPGVRVGFNPYKPDWGRVSIGDTRYDLVDGVPSTAKYAARMMRSFYLRAEGKRLRSFEEPFDLTTNFLRRRLSPSGQIAADVAAGRTLEGDRPTPGTEARSLLVPFVVEGMYDGWRDAGGSSFSDAFAGKEFKTGFRGAMRGLPGAFGVPSSTDRKRGRSDTGEPFDISDIVEQ